MRHLTLLSAVLCIVSSLAIAADPPQTKAGRSAIERYTAARQKLDAEYQAKLAALNRQLATELRAAIKQATRNGDLADAQALQEYLDRLVGRTYTFQIDAAKDWQPTIEVKAEQKIVIEAEGGWCADVRRPNDRTSTAAGLTVNGRHIMYLEGRIGTGRPTQLDEYRSIVADADGVLDT